MYESLVAEYLDYDLPSYVPRHALLRELPSPARRNIIHSLIGVRRCGKTFYLFQLMDELRKAGVPSQRMLYFPFDDDRLEPMASDTAARVLDAYYKLVPDAREGCYLFLDEIQEAPNWDAFVRRVAEQENATLVITGSSSKLLSTDIPTKLRGRSLACDMWPLSFAEYCDYWKVEYKGPGSQAGFEQGKLQAALERYLDCGGFPAVQQLSALDRVRMLQAYADEILTKDVLERFETTSYRVGRRFARSALRSTGLKFSVNKQINSLRSAGLSVSNDAAYALLDDFEDAHLIFKVADYARTIRDNPKASYKVYAVDPGLSAAVAPASHVDLGQRLETAVYIELKRRYGALRDNVIARYTSRACPEVDFVVGDILLEAEHELIQVAVDSGRDREGNCSPSDKWRSELGNLERAMGETGLTLSTLVTFDERDEVKVSTGIVELLPAREWLLQL